MKEKFIEAAPKAVAEAFAEVGAHAVPGEDFVATHNRLFGQLLNKVGKTLFNDTIYTNRLQHLYSESMPYGDFIEMVSTEVDSWVDDASIDGGSATRDQLKQYKADVIAHYSDLSAVITAPVTIYDKAARRAFTSPEVVDRFYTDKLIAMRNSMEYRKYMLAKELIHRAITDKTHEGGTVVLEGVAALDSEDAALAFAEKLGEIVLDMTISTKKYNPAGRTGQASEVDIYIRPSTYAKYKTQLRKVFHEDPVLTDVVNFIIVDDFGGIESSVEVDYSTVDGSQTEDMSEATWTDPHADTICVLAERGTFVATVDWEDVEDQRDAAGRATTYHPLSSHHFAVLPWKALVEIKFDTEEEEEEDDGIIP